MRIQFRSQRKATGGMYNSFMKKKKVYTAREFLPSIVGEEKKKQINVAGGNRKIRIRFTNKINVSSAGKTKTAKIITVKENNANLHFVRRNAITKGAVVETDMGLVRVTSRPNQDGVVNGVLVQQKA